MGIRVVTAGMMTKILTVGCSFTDGCGFNEENKATKHWVSLLESHYKCIVDNRAHGGASNDEIFYRTLESLHTPSYDMIIVQWSGISRHWIYFNKCNIDDCTITNSGSIKGFVLDEHRKDVEQYVKLHYALFDNHYVNIKKWLLQILALQDMLKNVPFAFIKGFDNYLDDFQKVSLTKSGFSNMSKTMKSMLDFDNRPDDYIYKKIQHIQQLINQINKSKWVNFDSLPFNSNFNFKDLADDQLHPGPAANKQLFLNVLDYCESNNILL